MKQENAEVSQALCVSQRDNLLAKNLFHPNKSSVNRLLLISKRFWIQTETFGLTSCICIACRKL